MAQYTKDTFKFTKPNRSVWMTFCHCSASDNPDHDNVETMTDWHVNGNGWSDCGYHYYIQKDGTIEDGRSIESTPAAQSGYNTGSIAICCGGLEDFTYEQADALYAMCDQINLAYNKDMPFYGHNQVAAKSCPVYDWTMALNLNNSYMMTTSNIDSSMPNQIPVYGGLPEGETPPSGPSEEISPDIPGWNDSPFRNISNDLPMIRKGDKGLSVAALQSGLTAIGDIIENVNQIDGVFDSELEKKIKRIQEAFQLDADGIVGSNTWPAIFHFDAVMRASKADLIDLPESDFYSENRIEDI